MIARSRPNVTLYVLCLSSILTCCEDSSIYKVGLKSNETESMDRQLAIQWPHLRHQPWRRLRLKCDGTRAETRFRLSAKRTSPFKSAGASVQSTTGSRGVRISGGNSGYTIFRGGVKGTGYPLHSPVSPSLPLPCVTVCHQISTGLYIPTWCSVQFSAR